MPTTQTSHLLAVALCASLSVPACEDKGDRPTIDVNAIEPDPLPPDASQPGAPGVFVVPSPRPSLDAGGSTPAPPPQPVADSGRDAALSLPGVDPLGFDASISPPNAR